MNKSSKNSIEDIFKESLGNFEAEYNPSDWVEMEAKLDNKAFSENPNKHSINKILLITSSIVITALMMFFYLSKENPAATHDDSIIIENNNKVVPFNTKKGIQTIFKKDEINNTNKSTSLNNISQTIPKNESKTHDPEESHDPSEINGTKDIQNKSIKSNEITELIQEKPILDMLRKDPTEFDKIPIPIATFSASIDNGCIPLSVVFSPKNADIGTRYMWDFGDGYFSNEPSPTHTYTEAGTYPVSLRVTSIINEKTNTHTSKNLITGFPAPEVNFELMQNQKTLDNKEVTFINHSIDVTKWSWLFGDGNTSIEKNPNHKYSDIGNYNVQLIGKNSYGCADTAIGFVSILGSNYSTKLYAPTAFSPNGDGVNDEFRPLMVGENLKYDLAIYDRNGAVIFQSKDINTAWNGKIGDGEQAPFGTYIWLIIIQDEFGKETKQLGQVTVIK